MEASKLPTPWYMESKPAGQPPKGAVLQQQPQRIKPSSNRTTLRNWLLTPRAPVPAALEAYRMTELFNYPIMQLNLK